MSAPFAIRSAAADDGHTVFILSGRLDAGHAASLKDVLKETIDTGTVRLVVDMAAVPFIDSAGLSALVFGLKHARRAGGDLALSGVPPQTLTVLSLTMLDKVFSIRPTSQVVIDEAIHDRAQQS
jgi:anti-sigma B factor antagonist